MLRELNVVEQRCWSIREVRDGGVAAANLGAWQSPRSSRLPASPPTGPSSPVRGHAVSSLGNVLSLTDPVAWAAGDRINSRRNYAYLHEFDHEGNYLESTVESPGNGEEARQAAMLLLEEWIAGLPGLAYSDIAIRPFQFEQDAITFGLIIEDGHGTDWVELYPDRLGFHAPWDGSYDTLRLTGTFPYRKARKPRVSHIKRGRCVAHQVELGTFWGQVWGKCPHDRQE
jgi:hypothetical protein